MPRASNLSTTNNSTQKKSARADDKKPDATPTKSTGLKVPTRTPNRGLSAQKKKELAQEDTKVDMNADPIGMSLKKRTKEGKILPDAVREVGIKAKEPAVFKLK